MEQPTAVPEGPTKPLQAADAGVPRRPWYAGALQRWSIMIGGALLLVVLAVTALAPIITPFDPNLVRPEIQFIRPNSVHLFGTDNFGRDLFSRTVYGARNSLLIGSSVVLMSCLLGTIGGLLAGFYRRLDTVLMGAMDSLMAFPGIVLAVAIMAAIGPRLQNVIIALGIVQIGLSDIRILLRHILPNCVSPLIVQATFIFGLAVLGEASLSFLGVGAPPYIPSWGNILGEARVYVRDAPYMMLLPGLALSITILGLNLMGDGIRDWLDPMSVARRLEAHQRAQ
jgi:peptide/nickel transport system permease protein